MKLTTDQANGVAVVRVGEARLMYPLLSEFRRTVTELIAAGEQKVLLDLSSVTYVDSATIGCLMDLYRQAQRRRRRAQAGRRAEARRDDADHDRRAELHRDSPGRAAAPSKASGHRRMRTIKTDHRR